ncbi:MAG: cytochrome c5 family protein [Rhodocyclales bacterium]|nr:MAG: cytochrome c5 family protein [Rhodocyclales bacterium]
MAEQNEQCGGLCASPALIAVALVAALALPIGGYFVAKLIGGKPAADLGEEAAMRRIQPMAQVSLAGSASGGAKAAKGSEEIYKTTCAACHDAGVAGAPKTGDKAAWAPRIGVGLEKLAASGIQGKGAMPPKGGADISDADFTRVVAWLANKSGASFKEPAAPKAEAAAAPAEPAPAPAAAAPAPAPAPAAAAPAAGNGKKVYDSACVACHASGVAGAPKFGDKGAWAPRLATGLDALTASVIKGKGAMPPKGGNASIPDADIRAAVEYMTAAAK